MMEISPETQEDLGTGGRFKNWLQDNVRIILSVLIVLAIAGGIYSYSKRSEPLAQEQLAMEQTTENDNEQIAENKEQQNDSVTIIGEENENREEAKVEEAPQQEQEQKTEQQVPVEEEKEDVKVTEQQQSSTSVSEETNEAFVESAARGDSVTTLARQALGDYLEKNNDSSLTREHKIYIEDYLRRQVGHSGTLHVGDKISFSKVLIKDAIEKSKTLNDNQLNNLKQFSARVSQI